MEVTGGDVVLIVNGALIRDDADVIATILEKVHAIMENAAAVNMAMDELQQSISHAVTEIEDLLTQPQVDTTAIVDKLHGMQSSVDTVAQRVHEAAHPESPQPMP